MDKNMMNIDDLFRRKLSGAEEKEREGAWLRMSELLEKEMPREKAAGISWTRPALFAGALLLATTIGISAYHANKNGSFAYFGNAASTGKTGTSFDVTAANSKGANNNSGSESATNQSTVIGKPTASKQSIADEKLGSDHTQKSQSATSLSSKSQALTQEAGNSHVSAAKTLNTPHANKNIVGQNIVSGQTKHAVTTTKQSEHEYAAAVPSTASKTAEKAIGRPASLTGSKQLVSNSPTSASVSGSEATSSTNSLVNHKGKYKNRKSATHLTATEHSLAATSSSSSNQEPEIKTTVLHLLQRTVKDENNTWHFAFDTISTETLVEQFKNVNQTLENNFAFAGDKKSGVMTNAVASSTPDAGALSTKPAELSEEPSLKANTELAKNKQQKSAGARLIDNLGSAFNDVKIASSNMQFTKGLTAGLNGTFFGPSSFYGFQFGLSGTFAFGDHFSIKTELKYIHRVNTNYQLNDDYYEYEQNSSGGYRKSRIDYDFSFSTVHSFELPIAFKYSVNNFSFFGGGNFVYTFGVNTDAAPLPDPNTPVMIVATKGTDDHATLSYKDFGQRFGIGYLFGIAFKLNSRSEIDLRTVQTVWDNMTTAGAKSVSSELYKSPSLQASFNYRIGKSHSDQGK